MSTIPGPAGPVARKPWQTGLAPVYIGIFLWIAFADQIGKRALPIGGLRWSMLGAVVAGPFCYLLLFRIPATWGLKVGKPLDVVACSTFGVRGASLVPGLLIALGQVVFFAIAIGYAVDMTMQGLVLGRLVNPASLKPIALGESSIPSPLFLLTSLVWAYAAALVSLWFVRWIAALMQYFPIFPALMLGLAMVLTIGGLSSFRPTFLDPIDGATVPELDAGWRAFLLTFQWVFAFTAMAGVMGADWGAASVGPSDVREGGWVAVALAPMILSILTLLTVAGFQGTVAEQNAVRTVAATRPGISDVPRAFRGKTAVVPATLKAVMTNGFDPRLGSAMFLTFGLASMAPAVYGAFVFSTRFSTIGPRISKLTWAMFGASAAWLMIVGGWFDRTETLFGALGATFAPVAGAMAADYTIRRGRWPGPRRGINPAGLLAWGLGVAVGLIPILGRAFGAERLSRFQPASLAAFGTAFVAYLVLALLRLESKAETVA